MRLSVTAATLAVHYFNSNDENICELFKLDVSLSWLPFSSEKLTLYLTLEKHICLLARRESVERCKDE